MKMGGYSIALPGLFKPSLKDAAILVDGGLVNPVPVSLARVMGADFVIAVDLTSGVLSKKLNFDDQKDKLDDKNVEWIKKFKMG